MTWCAKHNTSIKKRNNGVCFKSRMVQARRVVPLSISSSLAFSPEAIGYVLSGALLLSRPGAILWNGTSTTWLPMWALGCAHRAAGISEFLCQLTRM